MREGEKGRRGKEVLSEVQDQPGLHSKILSQTKKQRVQLVTKAVWRGWGSATESLSSMYQDPEFDPQHQKEGGRLETFVKV